MGSPREQDDWWVSHWSGVQMHVQTATEGQHPQCQLARLTPRHHLRHLLHGTALVVDRHFLA